MLLEAVYHRYGYDFRHYARASLTRRINHLFQRSGLKHLSEMIPKVLHEELFFDQFLNHMSITVTEMFRDPYFFAAIREKVIPALRTYPFIKIWHAGCSTGEEVYSMAIALKEEEFYDRSQIYATDYNKKSLFIAQEGIYSISYMQQYIDNYNKAGGKCSLSDYCFAKYKSVKMSDSLKENITFAHHNLTTDGVFGEMNLIICRNTLIYFDRTLQDRVLNLFADSLCYGGFLCLGTKETLDFSTVKNQFETLSKREKIFKKIT